MKERRFEKGEKKELGQEAKTWVKSIKENEVTAAIRSTRKLNFDQKKRRDNKRTSIIFLLGS